MNQIWVPKLYCDCDGVLFNTIDVAYDMMRELGCDMHNRHEINYYFKKVVDWNEIFRRSSIINNSIEKVQILKDSYAFKDVKILTCLSGNSEEERLKRMIFGELLPGINVITVQYGIPKALVIPNLKESILVDDEKRNCLKWAQYGGVAILFSREVIDLKNNIINDLLDIPYSKGYKSLVKTRNF